MDFRAIAIDSIERATGMDKPYAQDCEIGIFNWSIDFAETNRVVRSWRDERFIWIYKNAVRRVLFNIDPDNEYVGNKRLLPRLIEGEFKPHDIPYMSPDNMFPEKWQDLKDKKLKREQSLLNSKKVANTTLYTCFRCKKNECNYYELQTRSADEPMTTFINCLNCGNNWRM